MYRGRDRSERGQVLVLFALALTAVVLGAAVVVDGGYAFAQRRETQNAADFAAMAGTRVVGMAKVGKGGTAAGVNDAIEETLAANGAQRVSAQYVDTSGAALGPVTAGGTIPSRAFGVVVEARTDWRPFLLGVIGVTDWASSANATAMTRGNSIGGSVMPVGVNDARWNEISSCPPGALDDCTSLTPGTQIVPGQFGWLKFGLGNKCDWAWSLGMTAGGCENNVPFLTEMIGNEFEAPNSFGCCTAVGQLGPNGEPAIDLIGGFTGNSTEQGDLDYYIENEIPVWVPIYDTAQEQGSHADYHIVGFGALIFLEQSKGNGNGNGGGGGNHAKWLQGVAIQSTCSNTPGNHPVKDAFGNDLNYCIAPDGAFLTGATGAVQLVR